MLSLDDSKANIGFASDSRIGQQRPGSAMCGIDAFLLSVSNYTSEDVCFCPMVLFNLERGGCGFIIANGSEN